MVEESARKNDLESDGDSVSEESDHFDDDLVEDQEEIMPPKRTSTRSKKRKASV